ARTKMMRFINKGEIASMMQDLLGMYSGRSGWAGSGAHDLAGLSHETRRHDIVFSGDLYLGRIGRQHKLEKIEHVARVQGRTVGGNQRRQIGEPHDMNPMALHDTA